MTKTLRKITVKDTKKFVEYFVKSVGMFFLSTSITYMMINSYYTSSSLMSFFGVAIVELMVASFAIIGLIYLFYSLTFLFSEKRYDSVWK